MILLTTWALYRHLFLRPLWLPWSYLRCFLRLEPARLNINWSVPLRCWRVLSACRCLPWAIEGSELLSRDSNMIQGSTWLPPSDGYPWSASLGRKVARGRKTSTATFASTQQWASPSPRSSCPPLVVKQASYLSKGRSASPADLVSAILLCSTFSLLILWPPCFPCLTC